MRYPLIEKYLPKLDSCLKLFSDGKLYFCAEDLERELANGVELFCTKTMTDRHSTRWITENPSRDDIHGVNWNTHSGLCIGIQPIEHEVTAESLLRKIVERSQHNGTIVPYEFVDEIRAFLEKQKWR